MIWKQVLMVGAFVGSPLMVPTATHGGALIWNYSDSDVAVVVSVMVWESGHHGDPLCEETDEAGASPMESDTWYIAQTRCGPETEYSDASGEVYSGNLNGEFELSAQTLVAAGGGDLVGDAATVMDLSCALEVTGDTARSCAFTSRPMAPREDASVG